MIFVSNNKALEREGDMHFVERRFVAPATAVGALVLSLALTFGAAQAQDKTFVMKISTPTLNAAPDRFARSYAAAIEKDSGGRIKVEVYPASQLGSIPRQIEGTQFGAIQCEVIPPEFMVGIDERFEIMAAPGLINSMEHGERLAADPEVLKLMLGLGANKGLYGAGMFMGELSAVIARSAIRHLDDFKGKKIRTFASQFQSTAWGRLGATPVAMSLGDVLPAIQQGAIDGAIAGPTIFTGMHFMDAAKYVTEIGQPGIFLVVELNRKWYESLPEDLQQVVQHDAALQSVAINPQALDILNKALKGWTDGGGEEIHLPPDEQASLLKTFSSVGEDVSKSKPELAAAYKIVSAASQRTR
jgi:TRAP-type C4-dicarboxylate transport system substrate-binding protein